MEPLGVYSNKVAYKKLTFSRKKRGISGSFTCKEGIADSLGFRGRFNPES
jgi:hypothetical protein